MWDGIFAGAVIAALFAVTLWLSVVLAHSLDFPQNVTTISAVFLPESGERDIEEEQPEGPLATGYRSERSIAA